MIPVAKLKQNLDFNKTFGELIEVMRLAATLQFNQFRLAQAPYPDFITSIEKTFAFILERKPDNRFLNSNPQDPAAVVLISPDESFLGELNTVLVNKLLERKRDFDQAVVLGQQGENYLRELNIEFKTFPSISDKLEIKQIEALRDHILGLYTQRTVSTVHIIYARFISITSQKIELDTVLPLSESLYRQPSGIKSKEILIEPDIGSIIEGSVKLWLSAKLYQVIWSSKLAEFAARIMHLEGSIQELKRINQNLRLEYFKYLHGLSDKTIREIYASRLVRRN